MSFKSWLKTGDIVGADFCYRELPDKLDIYDHEAFGRCQTPFYVTCSNVETGKPEYLQITDMKEQIDCLRASASLPYFSRLVEIDGKKYLDGGCTDSIPVEAFRKMGYQRNVVVLTREAAYRKKEELRFMPKLCYRKYPAFAQALLNRHMSYNETVDKIVELEKAGEIFVIRPEESLNIGRMEKDPENVQRVYDCGRKDAEKYMDSLIRWLSLN
jgi:predicted patatin/cPLA2 family phospholipase